MKSTQLFCVAFVLGFSACGALVYFYQGNSVFERKDFIGRSQNPSGPSQKWMSGNTDQQQDSGSFTATDLDSLPNQVNLRSVEQSGIFSSERTQSLELNIELSDSEYWLQQLHVAQNSGNTEQLVTALINYTHYELDAQKLADSLATFKLSYLHSVNQFRTNIEDLESPQLNQLEIQRFIDRVEPLLDAIPSDAEVHWLLSRLYLLIDEPYQSEFHAVMAASDPRYVQAMSTQQSKEHRQDAERSAPIEAPLIVPLRRHQNHFLVETKISGLPALLLLDTGASLTGVTQSFVAAHPRLAQNTHPILLNTAGGSVKGRLFTAKTMELGDLLFRDHSTVVFPMLQEQDFDGVLGLDVLGRFDFYIDQPRAELHLRYRIDAK